MGEINYDRLRAAINELQERYNYFEEVRSNPSAHEAALLQAVNNSVAYRFAICFERLWRHIRKYLQLEAVEAPKSPKAVFHQAHEAGTIDEWMLDRLLKYQKLRLSINCDYDPKREQAILDVAGDFIADAEDLYAIIAQPNYASAQA